MDDHDVIGRFKRMYYHLVKNNEFTYIELVTLFQDVGGGEISQNHINIMSDIYTEKQLDYGEVNNLGNDLIDFFLRCKLNDYLHGIKPSYTVEIDPINEKKRMMKENISKDLRYRIMYHLLISRGIKYDELVTMVDVKAMTELTPPESTLHQHQKFVDLVELYERENLNYNDVKDIEASIIIKYLQEQYEVSELFDQLRASQEKLKEEKPNNLDITKDANHPLFILRKMLYHVVISGKKTIYGFLNEIHSIKPPSPELLPEEYLGAAKIIYDRLGLDFNDIKDIDAEYMPFLISGIKDDRYLVDLSFLPGNSYE